MYCGKPNDVFVFERGGKSYAVCWHNSGSGMLKIPNVTGKVSYVDKLGGEEIPIVNDGDYLVLPLAGKRYLISELSIDELKSIFANAILMA